MNRHSDRLGNTLFHALSKDVMIEKVIVDLDKLRARIERQSTIEFSDIDLLFALLEDQQRQVAEARQRAKMAEADYAELRQLARRMFAEDANDEDALALWATAATVEHPGAALLTELYAARKVVHAMREIDHTPVGACEDDLSGMPEPCENCGDMRTIAENALAEYDQAVKARAR